MTNLWRVRRDWEGETCAILGAGPSMSSEVADAVRGRCRTIAVNSSYRLAPWADVLYAADRLWWANNPAAAEFAGVKATIMPNGYTEFTPAVDGCKVLGNGGPQGFDDRPDYLRTGWNSGYQAMHLAAHLGVKRVVLLGFDMHARNGEHWHGDHRWRRGYKSRYTLFVNAFSTGAKEFERRSVDVVNGTPGSALTCFRPATLEEALNDVVQQMRAHPPQFTGTRAPSSGGARASARRSQAKAEAEVDVAGG